MTSIDIHDIHFQDGERNVFHWDSMVACRNAPAGDQGIGEACAKCTRQFSLQTSFIFLGAPRTNSLPKVDGILVSDWLDLDAKECTFKLRPEYLNFKFLQPLANFENLIMYKQERLVESTCSLLV